MSVSPEIEFARGGDSPSATRSSASASASTVKDLVVGSALVFDDRGEHDLEGVPDTWRLYAAVGG